MDYSKITLFQMMGTKMGYHSQRQDVLAQNIANIDTPGYKPKNLDDLDFARMVNNHKSRLEVRITNPAHQADGSQGGGNIARTNEMRETYSTTPVKNSVVLEEQMMMLTENHMEYQKVTNLYAKVTSLFKTAIGNN